MSRAARHEVKLTHPERLLWPADGISKRDLYDYFGAVADVMVPHVKDRPVSLQRFRDSVEKGGFFQKEVPKGAPDWVATVAVPKRTRPPGVVHHVLADDRETLQWLAQQGCVTPHVFTARADRLDRPDRMVIDLDPSHDDFAAVRRAARQCGDGLRARGLEPFAMVTGSRGIHVVVPLKRTRSTEDVLAWVRAFAAELAAEQPDTLTTEFYKNKRDDRIYLDVARNGPAQTVVPPYAPRPRAGAPVATPLRWAELDDDGLRPDGWTLKTVLGRLDDLGADPWKDINKSARALPRG